MTKINIQIAMFGSSNKKKELDLCRCTIVYDKSTKSHALALFNRISNSVSCACWSRKIYEDNENRFTNQNFVIFLHADMIKEHFANPILKPVEVAPEVLLVKEGRAMGVYVNPKAKLTSFKKISSDNWKKYLTGVVAPVALIGGVPGAILISSLMFTSDKKKVKFKLLFDAVNKLVEDNTINDFITDKN